MCWSRRFWSNMWFLEKDQCVRCAHVGWPRSFEFQHFFLISVHTLAISVHETKYKIFESKEGKTYKLTSLAAVKGSKFSCYSGADSSAAGTDSLEAPKSSS
jgi:hypothetical protein